MINTYPTSIYLFKFNNGNTKTLCKNYSKLTTETPEQHKWRYFSVFIVNFEYSYSSGNSIIELEQVNVSWII